MRLLDVDVPTPIGSVQPMGKPWGGHDPKDSPAAQAIITAAQKASPENKLTVVCLGAYTNLASAIALSPEISANINAYLLGFRYDLEKGIWNKSSFNVRRDLNAADYLLNCQELQLSIMPANVARALTFERRETFRRHQRMGELGKYLTAKRNAQFAEFDTWIMWDLALVQAILDPSLASHRRVKTPPENETRSITLYDSISADAMRENYCSVIEARYTK